VRNYSCPTCGFEAGRNENTGYNVLQRGLSERGLGGAEVTPAEIALPASASDVPPNIVDARCVVETGSPQVAKRVSGERTIDCGCEYKNTRYGLQSRCRGCGPRV
jgi:hypothetical protein